MISLPSTAILIFHIYSNRSSFRDFCRYKSSNYYASYRENLAFIREKNIFFPYENELNGLKIPYFCKQNMLALQKQKNVFG